MVGLGDLDSIKSFRVPETLVFRYHALTVSIYVGVIQYHLQIHWLETRDKIGPVWLIPTGQGSERNVIIQHIDNE